MRTTLDIDDRVLERAKRHASSRGQTLGSLVSAALSAYLPSRSSRSEPPFTLIVRGRPGGRFPTQEEISREEQEEEVAALRIGSLTRRAAP